MKRFYAITEFNTIDKELIILLRASENDAKEQVQREINCIKENESVLEVKINYATNNRPFLGVGEHNAYVKTANAEYFWKIDCISVQLNIKE